MIQWRSFGFFLIVFTISINLSQGLRTELFKTCSENGFCNRNRHFATEISSKSYNSAYFIDSNSLEFDNSAISGTILKKLPNNEKKALPFILEVLKNDNIRLRVDEEERINPAKLKVNDKRFQTRRYNEASKYALKQEPELSETVEVNKEISKDDDGEFLILKYGNNLEYEAKIYLNNLKIIISYNGTPEIILNDRQFFNLEHWRSKDSQSSELLPQESNYNSFEDTFKDSKGDHLPFGPESIGVDVSFLGYSKVYGIPEHADTFSLKDTAEGEPYRLFNVDIFEYETQSKYPMYGSIPFMLAHKKSSTAGFFWINSADTYVDIDRQDQTNTKTHWFSEAGIVDLIIMLDKNPLKINEKFGELSGNPELPQLFTLGYHQCRWNYNDVDDVLEVSENFDKSEIPYDTIWLDIEYTENKKYFTWKQGLFGDHVEMNKKLDETGRNLVAIIDPHIKTDYEVSNNIIKKKIGIENSDNSDVYHGHCWPGESVWIDTLNPNSQAYWDSLFANNTNFAADETNLHIWNDMSEPSVFSGAETTAPKDIIHYGGWEHRSVHNLYGLTFHEATYESLKERYVNKRPFILTRAYYTGSQRTAAMWSGDNRSKWEFLKISLPMALTSQVVGMPFTGSDVGGFFGNPSSDLLTRWYQTGIWYPFFRAHAHIDSKRREPFLIEQPYQSIIKDAIKLRYSLLPVFYTAFYQSSVSNDPILVPMIYSNPENEKIYDLEDQFFVGNSGLLVKPVTEESATEVNIYIPDEKPYFDYATLQLIQGEGEKTLKVDMNSIPILMQGGNIFARKDRYRRSSKLMRFDPYTLTVVLNDEGKAEGSLYIDDGETFNYKQNDFVAIDFKLSDGILSSKINYIKETPFIKSLDKIKIEKIVVVGKEVFKKAIAQVEQDDNVNESEVLDINENGYIIRNPGVSINKPWTIKI